MSFFDAMRMSPASDLSYRGGKAGDRRLLDAWGLEEESGIPTPPSDLDAEGSAYDRAQWWKKLKRILDELPDSRVQWDELMMESRALGFEPEWVSRVQRDEFTLLIRRAIADRRFTEAEHRKLEMARELIGLPEAEAADALRAVVADAERFFGAAVEEG